MVDPAEGMRRVSAEEFSESSTRVALELMPTVALQQKKPGKFPGIEGVIMLMLGAGKVTDGGFSVGMLLAFTSYADIFSTRARSLLRELVDMRMLRLHQQRIADIAMESMESPKGPNGV